MDRPTDELLQRLLSAVAAGAGGDVTRLVAEARAEAEAEVKDVIKTAMKAVLLRRAVDQLESGVPARPDAQPQAPVLAPEPTEVAPPVSPTACYVYAITRASWGATPPELPAIDRRWRLRTVAAGDLQAVVSDVSLDEFGPVGLEERLRDLQWVEQKVRAHDAAVKALSAAGTVIPCRFCTILAADDDARAALTLHRDAILRTLEAIDGKTEWGVKLLADTRASAPTTADAAAPAQDANREGSAGDAGRAYLAQKQQQRSGRRREDVLRAAAEAAEVCHRALFAASADAALLPTRDRGSSARGWHLALNAAYLVADADADSFRARVEDLAREFRPQGLRLDLTGPWPPYNFSALDLSGASTS